jgi:hypothetical protein
MDFDHVRGEKLGCVPQMSSVERILAEAAKCDVVCANCHRIRTQDTSPRTRRGQERAPANQDAREWQTLVGTMSDRAVFLRVGVSQKVVRGYRQRNGIPVYEVPKMVTPKPQLWHALAGRIPDDQVAEIGEVTRSRVLQYRKQLGIKPFLHCGAQPGNKSGSTGAAAKATVASSAKALERDALYSSEDQDRRRKHREAARLRYAKSVIQTYIGSGTP